MKNYSKNKKEIEFTNMESFMNKFENEIFPIVKNITNGDTKKLQSILEKRRNEVKNKMNLATYYYESDEYECYSLIAVTVDKDNLQEKTATKKACEIYVNHIVGLDCKEALEERISPNLRTKEYAFMKFAYGCGRRSIDKIIRDFEETYNDVLLIDGSLL